MYGCASGLPPAIPPTAATREKPGSVVADWDDLEAAAWAAAPRSELTVLHIRHPDDLTQEIELLSARDEVGLLIARREPLPPTEPRGSPLRRGEGVAISLEFSLGHFGDPAREWAFLTDLVDRLESLRGVDYAPIRWKVR